VTSIVIVQCFNETSNPLCGELGDNTTIPIPPIDNGTTIPPIDNGTTIPPIDNGTTIPPIDNGTTIPEPGNGTIPIPPIDNGTTVPPVDNGTNTNDTTTIPVNGEETPIGNFLSMLGLQQQREQQ